MANETINQGIPTKRELEKQYNAKLNKSRWTLYLEEFWPRLAFLLMLVILFALFGLYDLWSLMPDWLRFGVVGLFALGTIGSIFHILRTPTADESEALRKIENDSGIKHRPVSSWHDEMATSENDDEAEVHTSSLWKAHQKQLATRFKKARANPPESNLPRLDQYALRGLLLLLLVLGLFVQRDNSWNKIKTAFAMPKSVTATANIRVDGWLTPPVYTNKAPVLVIKDGQIQTRLAASDVPEEFDTLAENGGLDALKAKQEDKPFVVPENTVMSIRVSGVDADRYNVGLLAKGSDDIVWLLDEATIERQKAKKAKKESETQAGQKDVKVAVADSSKSLRKFVYKLKKSGQVFINGGRTPTEIKVKVTPDEIPVIGLTKKPEKTKRSTLLLSYLSEDDYGVARAKSTIRLPQERRQSLAPKNTPNDTEHPEEHMETADIPLGEPVEFNLNLPLVGQKKVEGQTYKDLTSHPWAGNVIEMRLQVWDVADNRGESAPVKFRLPEREFTNPLARSVVELRRYLIDHPSQFMLVADSLDTLSTTNKEKFKDLASYLGLRSAVRRLQLGRGRKSVRGIVDQLWNVALRIEEGNISQAEKELRAAQDKLADALSKGASPEQIEKLMRELKQALSKYMQALAKQGKIQKAQPNPMGQGDQQQISSQDLAKMLKDIENLAKSGSREAAQQMLSQLRNLLESMQRGGQQQQANQKAMQQMREMMNKLGNLTRQQQQLMDQTFRQQQKQQQQQRGHNGNRYQPESSQRPRFGGRRYGSRTRELEALRRRIEELRRRRQERQQGQQGNRRQGQQGNRGQRGRGQFGQFGQNPGQRQGQGRGQGRGKGSAESRREANSLRQQQEALRRELEALRREMNRMGGAPEKFGQAGSQMGGASRSLGQQQLGNATQKQGQALENLRQGSREMGQRMMQNMARRFGMGNPGNADPLGRQRPNGAPDPGQSVKVPDQVDVQRARQIYQNLQKRLSDPSRPDLELDYLERLIKRF